MASVVRWFFVFIVFWSILSGGFGWLARLDEAGAIYQAPDPRALRKEAVEAYLSALKAGKSSLLIAPLHRDLRKLAEEVRTELKNGGAIGRENYRIETLNRDDSKGEFLVFCPLNT